MAAAEALNEEQEYWRTLILELQGVITIAEIAEQIGVSDRQVWRWKDGDRPMGMKAIRVYLLHVKLCPPGQCLARHVASAGKSILS